MLRFSGGRRVGVAAHLDKVGKLGVTCCDDAVHVGLDFCALVVRIRAIVFGEAGFALPILQEEVLDHGFLAAAEVLLRPISAFRRRGAKGCVKEGLTMLCFCPC